MLMPDPQTTSQSPSCCSCCQSWHESFCSWGSSSNVSSWAKGTVSLHFWKENRLQLDLPVPWKQFPTVEIIALALWSSSPMISSWENHPWPWTFEQLVRIKPGKKSCDPWLARFLQSHHHLLLGSLQFVESLLFLHNVYVYMNNEWLPR